MKKIALFFKIIWCDRRWFLNTIKQESSGVVEMIKYILIGVFLAICIPFMPLLISIQILIHIFRCVKLVVNTSAPEIEAAISRIETARCKNNGDRK